MKLDNIDKTILNILQESDKYQTSYRELGKIVGKILKREKPMAASSIHARVDKMKKLGIIKKIGTIVDPLKVGFQTMALIGFSVDALKMESIAEKLTSFSQIQMVWTTTGDHDIIVQIIAVNDKTLWRFINKHLKTIDGVLPQMHVSIFLDFHKTSQKIHFSLDF